MEPTYQFYYAKKKSNAAPYEPSQLLCEWFNDELTGHDIMMLKIGMAYACRVKYKTGQIQVLKHGKLIASCLIG